MGVASGGPEEEWDNVDSEEATKKAVLIYDFSGMYVCVCVCMRMQYVCV